MKANVEATIGVPYELIAIDNAEGRYGICQAYNLGAARAQFGILCFMHEDIRLHTPAWGQVVSRVLQDTTIGVLGVTGGLWQVAAPAPWWGCGLAWCRENVLNVQENGQVVVDLRNPEGNRLTDAAVVDGMWLCSRREVWQQYPFDERTFPDFHFYDVDYCTEIFRHQLRVCISFEVQLEHHSRGSLNRSWAVNALRYVRKRRGQLPFGPVAPPSEEQARMELRAQQEFTGHLLRGQFPTGVVWHYLRPLLAAAPLNRDAWWLLRQWVKQAIFARHQR